jgi:hypothetical protein
MRTMNLCPIEGNAYMTTAKCEESWQTHPTMQSAFDSPENNHHFGHNRRCCLSIIFDMIDAHLLRGELTSNLLDPKVTRSVIFESCVHASQLWFTRFEIIGLTPVLSVNGFWDLTVRYSDISDQSTRVNNLNGHLYIYFSMTIDAYI